MTTNHTIDPSQYISPWTMKDGTVITIRPIRPEDEPLLVKFHQSLSERSVEFRYFHLIKLSQRVAHERLSRICFNDYDRELALIAERRDAETGQSEILGVTRLSKLPGSDEAEFAIVISDRWQNRGLGTELLRRVLQVARDEHVRRVTADILSENRDMQRLAEKLGFHLERDSGAGVMRAVLEVRHGTQRVT
jgi:acetyltransferase